MNYSLDSQHQRYSRLVGVVKVCFFWLPWICFGLHRWGLEKFHKRLKKRQIKKLGQDIGDHVQAIAEVEDILYWALVLYPGKALCLEKSLVRQVLLANKGIEAKVQIGVKLYPFESHSWIVYNNTVIGDSPQLCHDYHVIWEG